MNSSCQVLFFSVLRDVVGSAWEWTPMENHNTVADFLRDLFAAHPALRAWERSLLVAVNQSYAKNDEIIPPGAEIAVMPPVQGG